MSPADGQLLIIAFLLRSRASNSPLDCIRSGQDGENRASEDHQVERQRPIFDVVQIVLDAPPDLLERRCFASPSIHLRPAGNAGFYPMADRIVADRMGVG